MASIKLKGVSVMPALQRAVPPAVTTPLAAAARTAIHIHIHIYTQTLLGWYTLAVLEAENRMWS